MLTQTEENYLKAIYHISNQGKIESVSTNSLADSLNTTPASVNDMMKKLHNKNLIHYQKYKGATLLPEGKRIALIIIRKHRLWEVFLVEKLGFKWDEVHEVAEQLEHIQSPKLINQLDKFLDFPHIDPHGDPIPDENGIIKESKSAPLSEISTGMKGIIVAVNDDSTLLLNHLDKIGIQLGSKIKIKDQMEFDGSVSIILDGKSEQFISKTVAENLMVIISE